MDSSPCFRKAQNDKGLRHKKRLRDCSLNLLWIAALCFCKARNDSKETLVFNGFFYSERQLSVFKSRLSKSAFCFVDTSLRSV